MALHLSRMERQALAGFAITLVVMAVLHEVMQLKELGVAIQEQLLDDYYTVLGLEDTASQQDIITAIRRMTSQLGSKHQDAEGQLRRAKLVAAQETLMHVERRAAYDGRRRWVHLASLGLTAVCVGVPVLALLFLGFRLLRACGRSQAAALDPGSYEGRVTTALERIEASVEVALQKGGRGALLVEAVAPGGLVESHNQRARAVSSSSCGGHAVLAWWDSPEIWVGDLLAGVNGASSAEDMMREIGASASLNISMRRPLKALLPWVAELDLSRSSSSERWGCHLLPTKDGSDTLEVSSVEETGVLSRWNQANARLRVRPGDRLLAVNRELGVTKMLAQLQDSAATRSSWLIVRGAIAGPLAAEVTCGPFRKREGDKLGIRIGMVLEPPLRGSLVEPGGAGAVVVKDVVGGFLVDRWNQRPGVPKVTEGATVLSVNGKTDPREFATELTKSVVTLQLRPPRGSAEGHTPGEPRELAWDDVQEEPTPFWKFVYRLLPPFLRPRSFETRLREVFASLRCEFDVEFLRSGGDQSTAEEKVGLQVQPEHDPLGGLSVTAIPAGGLVDKHNCSLDPSDRASRVRVGDRLIAVNDTAAAGLMVEKLSDPSTKVLQLRFSRPAAQASPGVWEVEVERRPDEGWGMVLNEQLLRRGSRSGSVLRVGGVVPELAVDRWNRSDSKSSRWAVQEGDIVVACEPAVGDATRILARLREVRRARLTLVRWHCGPAPELEATGQAAPSTASFHAPRSFEVVLERQAPADRMGLRLEPSQRDPTRTAVAEVLSGGLVEAHNNRVLASRADASGNDGFVPYIWVGDEVEAVNGETDHELFASNDAQRVVLRMLRRSTSSPPSPPSAVAASLASFPAAAASPAPQAPVALQSSAPAVSAPGVPAPLLEEAEPAGWGLDDALEALDEAMLRTAQEDAQPPPVAASPAPVVVEPAGARGCAVEAVEPPAPERPAAAPAAAPSAEPAAEPAAAPPAAPPASLLPPEAAKEVFLLRAKVEQLRARLAQASTAQQELAALQAERDTMVGEQATWREQLARAQRSEAALCRAVEEAEARSSSEAAEARQRLEHSERRCTDLEQANARLEGEVARLTAQLAVRPAATMSAAGLESAERLEPALGRLDEGFARLLELSTSLDRVLSQGHAFPSGHCSGAGGGKDEGNR